LIREQLYLFEEHDILKRLVKDIDYVDLQSLPYDPQRKKYSYIDLQYNVLPKDKYTVFKKGGTNSFYKERGKIFPYVKNNETGKIIYPVPTKTDLYPKLALKTTTGKTILARMHRILGLAFLDNPDLYNGRDWVVGHIDDDVFNYELDNLEWCTQQQNLAKMGANKRSKSITTQLALQKLKGQF
jgi:hypothetical protein